MKMARRGQNTVPKTATKEVQSQAENRVQGQNLGHLDRFKDHHSQAVETLQESAMRQPEPCQAHLLSEIIRSTTQTPPANGSFSVWR